MHTAYNKIIPSVLRESHSAHVAHVHHYVSPDTASLAPLLFISASIDEMIFEYGSI